MPYNYTDSQITERASSGGKDPGRMKTAQELATRAKAGDQAALTQLLDLTGGPGDPHPGNEWATMDAKNYGAMMLRDLLPGYQPDYGKAHDGQGFFDKVGSGLGSVLKVAAPIAALAIPGLGPLASAAIAAGGSAAGGLLKGEKFDLGKTVMAGAAGYGGNKLLGGQGINGIGGIPGRLGIGGGGGTPPLDPGMSGGAQGGGGGGILGGIFGQNPNLQDILGTVGMIGGGIQAAGAQASADKNRDAAIAGATGEWNSRAPLRTAAQQGMLGLGQLKAPDLSGMFADPGNPFYRPPLVAGAA